MRAVRSFIVTTVGVLALCLAPSAKALAQVSIGINIGAPPVCPYGYFDYAPYNCAPYGYYGPQWFNRGVFFGAGPWFHGPRDFYGQVNHGFDPRYGYRGGFPEHGGYREPDDHFRNFHPSHERDGYGHERGYGHDNGNGKDHGGGNGNGHGHD